MTDADAARYLQYYAEGNYEYALRYLDIIAPPATSYFLDTLLTVVMSIVGAGFILFSCSTPPAAMRPASATSLTASASGSRSLS